MLNPGTIQIHLWVTILNERKIEAELGEDKLDHNIQRLGFWPTYNQKSAISETEWNELKVDDVPELIWQAIGWY